MKNIRVLDCTLRDGGRVIEGDCAFLNEEIRDISKRLANAKIDIIEVGFLRDWHNVKYTGNSTMFTDVDQIKTFISNKTSNVLYVAFVDFGMFDFDSLKPYDGESIDGIRFGFTKKNYLENYKQIVKEAKEIKEKGYKLFIQGVNSLNYTDKEMLEFVELVNEIHPYSFGIVDTYGAMYVEDVERIFRLVDNNLDTDICIDFHSHNNYQLSFALAQEVIKLCNGRREVIVDCTLNGMGKEAGNLNTELIVDFLCRKMHYNYDFDEILDVIDDYIYQYKVNKNWGYSVPAMLAGIYKSHPNNIIYLTQKMRLKTKDIKNMVSMIEPQKRQQYDYDNIESLYVEYIADKVNDLSEINKLKEIFLGKEVLVLVPGNSLNIFKDKIEAYIKQHNPIVISVNFVYDLINSYSFFGNEKRYLKEKEKGKKHRVIVTSNIKAAEDNLVVNYHSLINREYKFFENSTIMLLNLLKRIDVKTIAIAGFDGFSKNNKNNYCNNTFQNDRHIQDFDELNNEISKMLEEITKTLSGKCSIQFITPSIFSKAVENA